MSSNIFTTSYFRLKGPNELYTNIMLDTAKCQRYTQHFASWLHSCLQVTGCHFTNTFVTPYLLFLILVVMVRIKPGTS